jgi:predicted CXXCH cytochrome family protein
VRETFRRNAKGFIAALICAVIGVGCPTSQDPRVGYVGTNTCLGCHNGTSAPDVQDYRQNIHFAEGVGCEDCHGPGAVHVRNAGRGGLFITNPREGAFEASYGTCAGCHADTVGQFLQSEHAIQQVATCYDCHQFHQADSWYLPFKDNRICLQCHLDEFPDDAAVTAHTHHPNEPEEAASRCVACHMQPLSRGDNQQAGHFNHSLNPVEPLFSNAAMDAGIFPAPANSCSGVVGCHDGSNPRSPFRDPNNRRTNEQVQQIYDLWFGDDKGVDPAAIVHWLKGA